MAQKYNSKKVDGAEVTPTRPKVVKRFHFAGGGDYEPMSVTAASREEAEKEWKKKRVKISNS